MLKLASTLAQRNVWPWLLLISLTLPAVWHVAVFPSEIDREFPKVERPTFNRYPPPSYRLAEPGDTIDRIQIYISSLAIVLSLLGLIKSDNLRPWIAALALALAAFWHAANPGPTFDGWHGIGWRALFDPASPWALRIALAISLAALIGLIHYGAGGFPGYSRLWRNAGSSQAGVLSVVSALLFLCGLGELTDFEPFGYWPRWELVWGLAGGCCVLLIALKALPWRPRIVARSSFAGFGIWILLVSSGIWLSWYHRPLQRFREIVPGKIFISAIPTAKGLEMVQQRHHFKTIINLFPEDGPLQSPRWPEEVRFAKDHGLTYLNSTNDPDDADAFLDLTLKVAQDPDAWPILVHCHACMDRTPAWVGIYQFVVEGKPLIESFKFIEQHRGYRPKGSVTLLYDRVLKRLAPERSAADPLASRLSEMTHGTKLRGSNAGRRNGLSAATATDPSLTPRR